MRELTIHADELFRMLEAWFHDKNEWWDGFSLDGEVVIPAEIGVRYDET